MNRIPLLTRLLLALFAFCLGSGCGAATRPNIAIFIMDDVGQSDVGAFGNPAVQTPNIDQLAREGMRFQQAFLTTSSCTASRASILTGRYPHNSGAPGLGDSLQADINSLPRSLHEAGYYTASVGKWHLGQAFKSHFDRVVENREASGAADWLPELAHRPADKPFFFWFASTDAHIPYEWISPMRLQDPHAVRIHPWSKDSPYERQMLAFYYSEIQRADNNIGRVIARLKATGELDNTIVIVLSDNGTMFGGAKTSIYDEGVLTPLVIRYPRNIAANSENRQLVSSMDLAPTLLQLAGISPPNSMQGVSLLPTLADPQQSVREFVYAERNNHAQPFFERAVRSRDFLYKRNYLGRRLCDPYADTITGDKPRDTRHEEFYRMPDDPLARHNLVDDPAFHHELALSRQTMNQLMYHTNDTPPPLVMEQCLLRPLHDRIAFPENWQL